ncbi:MAG TPA: ammonium transporter [Rhizomicrobium sp.]|nr:ammonium transporter [Rhizomicrobium sp.]
MKIQTLKKIGRNAAAAGSALMLTAGVALAQAPAAPPTPDKGDTAWMLVSTILVLLMIVPGLALFYGGLVRAKNMLSVLTQTLVITCVVMIVWALWGYSMAFTDGGSLNSYVGGFSKALLKGVDPSTVVETFSRGVVIPEIVFVAFQMTFAAITTALVIGGFAERIKFSAVVAFAILWPTLVYFPIAHMVWWWPGPEFASTNPADATIAGAGMIWGFGALDFAGGTVVHINAGIAALVGAILVGKRVGYHSEPMAPHSLTLTMVGASLLWVGWFGFNAGSNLEANGYAGLAMINTFLATAAAGFVWPLVEWITKGKPSLLGAASGVVAGLVAITPAAGFAGPVGALVLGAVVSPVCLFFVSVVKNALKYDDSLDVFGVHAIGGIIGAIATGILVDPALGGAGIVDYTAGGAASYPGMATQVIAQLKGVLTTLVWSGVGSTIVFLVIKVVFGLRVTEDKEREGLDITEHGERAYNA